MRNFQGFLICVVAGIFIFLIVHVLNARAAYLTRKQWSNLCVQAADYHDSARQRQAVASLKRALVLADKLEDRDKALGLTLNNLGEVYHSQGDYSAAAKTLLRALRFRRKACGQNSYEAALTLRNLAGVMEDRGDYRDALETQIEAMGAAKAADGPDYYKVAMFKNDLGGIYIRLRQYTKAEATIRDALKTAQRLKDDRSEASAMTSLSYVCSLEGKFREAETIARRAVVLSRAAFGPDQRHDLTAACNLGRALAGQQRYAEAKKVYEQALQSSLRLLGEDHPQTAMLQSSLSGVLLETADYAKAESLAEDGLATARRMLGPLHRETVTALVNLVEILMSRGKNGDAEALVRRQLSDAEKIGGPTSAALAGTWDYYAWFLRKTGRSAEAGQAKARAKKIMKERHRRNLPDPEAPPAFPVA